MKKYMTFLLIAGLLSFMTVGCGGSAEESTTPDEGTTTPDEGTTSSVVEEATVTVAAYCGDCGHAKGSETCCAEDGEACEKCGLHKGSALCCKLTEDVSGKALCAKCGHVGKSEECCAEGAEVCEKCGLHKGSTLCCKL